MQEGWGGASILALFIAVVAGVRAELPPPAPHPSPVAVVARIDAGPVQLTPAGTSTAGTVEPGDLLYPGDTIQGGFSTVVECHDGGSTRWPVLGDLTYTAGKGGSAGARSIQGSPCSLPNVAVSTDEQHLDVLTAQSQQSLPSDFEQRVVDEVDRELGAALDSSDPLSLLRRAVALETRGQLTLAIGSYSLLQHQWDKARWIVPKIDELKITLARKIYAQGPKSGAGHLATLAIGVSENFLNDPNFRQLHYAHLDAEAFGVYAKLIDPGRKPEVLTNAAASLAGIDAALTRLATQAADGSTAVVFISTHGFQDASGSYIAAYDAHRQVGASTTIAVSQFFSRLSAFARTYMFVDACRNEAKIRAPGENNVHAAIKSYADRLLPIPGAGNGRFFVLLSTEPGYYSAEGREFADPSGPLAQDGHGAFTYYLLKWLYFDGAGPPGQFTRGQLVDGLRRAMQRIHQAPDGGGTVGAPDPLDPLRERPLGIPQTTGVPRPIFQLAAYAPQQAPAAPDALARVRAALAPSVITQDAARRALATYRQLDPASQERLHDTLLVALEDAGQRLLLNYLDGYQTEPDVQQFLDGREYYTLAEELAPGSPLLRARVRFNAGRARLFDFLSEIDRDKRRVIFNDSVGLLRDAYRYDPGPYVLNALGIAFMENGDWDPAIAAFRDALQKAPLWLYPKHNLALSLMRSGHAREAIAEYRRAISDYPTAHTLHLNLGLLYQQINDRKNAAAEYRTAEDLLKTGPPAELARVYNAQGTLEAQRGAAKKALALYDKAHQLAKDMPEPIHNTALLSTADVKEKLLSGNLRYLNSRIELARLLKEQNRVPEAIKQYEEILRQRSDFAAARLELAELYLIEPPPAVGQLPRAQQQLSKAEESGAGYWKVWLVRAEVARAQGRTATAKAAFREARRRAPDGAARREIRTSEKQR